MDYKLIPLTQFSDTYSQKVDKPNVNIIVKDVFPPIILSNNKSKKKLYQFHQSDHIHTLLFAPHLLLLHDKNHLFTDIKLSQGYRQLLSIVVPQVPKNHGDGSSLLTKYTHYDKRKPSTTPTDFLFVNFIDSSLHPLQQEYHSTLSLCQNIVKLLSAIKPNGTLSVAMTFVSHQITIEVLYLLSHYFSLVKFSRQHSYTYISEMSPEWVLQLHNFNNPAFTRDRSHLTNLQTQTARLTSDIPLNYFSHEYYFYKFDQQSNTNKIFLSRIVLSVDSSFVNFVTSFQLKINLTVEKAYKYFKKVKDYPFTLKHVLKMKDEMITYAKNICYKKNMMIKSQFADYNYKKLLSRKKDNIIKQYFPPHKNQHKVFLSLEALYSVSHYRDNEMVIKYLLTQQYQVDQSTLVDATANVGGVTIYMAQHFNSVIAIEYDSVNYDSLKNNVKLYKLQNVKCVKKDSVDLLTTFTNIKHKVIFFDPPWGGMGYRSHDKLDMYLGTSNVKDLIMLSIYYYDYVVLKAPVNFNFSGLHHLQFKLLKMTKYHIYVFEKA